MINKTPSSDRLPGREDSAVVTSRDGYNRNRPAPRAGQTPSSTQRPQANWELDADELDRYMSGKPGREPRFDPYGRPQSTGRTERPQAPPSTQPAQQGEWIDDDFGYEDQFEYDEYEPVEAATPPRQSQTRAPKRKQASEPEQDDDLYDDPFVLDDDEMPRRQPRRPQRQGRARPQRQPNNFSLPPAIAEAPIVKDRTTLIMMGVGLLSLLVMTIVVATRLSTFDGPVFTQVNANGAPQRLQEANVLWRLPLIAGMVSLISGVLAWFLARWDLFLSRFLLGGAIGVQFIVWIAVIAYFF